MSECTFSANNKCIRMQKHPQVHANATHKYSVRNMVQRSVSQHCAQALRARFNVCAARKHIRIGCVKVQDLCCYLASPQGWG